jgi:hypothetical protein
MLMWDSYFVGLAVVRLKIVMEVKILLFTEADSKVNWAAKGEDLPRVL